MCKTLIHSFFLCRPLQSCRHGISCGVCHLELTLWIWRFYNGQCESSQSWSNKVNFRALNRMEQFSSCIELEKKSYPQRAIFFGEVSVFFSVFIEMSTILYFTMINNDKAWNVETFSVEMVFYFVDVEMSWNEVAHLFRAIRRWSRFEVSRCGAMCHHQASCHCDWWTCKIWEVL